MKKKNAILLVLAMTASLLGGTVACAEESQTEETVLRVGLDGNASDISPYGTMSAGRGYLFRYLYEYMAQRVSYGASLDEMELVCAKSIEKTGDLTYKIEMYDYITDAAGNKITANDYVWSANTMKESGNYEKVNSYLESITAISDYEVEMVLTQDSLGTIEYLLSYIPVISQAAYEASEDEMHTAPVTTASYQVDSYISGSSIVLTKNENYWQTDESLQYSWAPQNVDRIEFSIITEASQMTIALESGNIDVAERVSTNEISYFMNDDGSSKEGYIVAESAASAVNSIIFNCSDESPLADEKVRQAICYAIDSEEVMTAAVNGLGFSLNAFASPLASDYVAAWDEEDYYNVNVDKAKELLAEAGYADGLNLKIMCENNDIITRSCQVMQGELAAVGINLELFSVENALFSSYESDPTQWDIIYVQVGCDDYCTFTWTLTFNADSFTWDGCIGFIVDDELQKLYNAAANAETHSEETVNAFQEYLTEHAYGYALYSQNRYVVANENTVDSIVLRDGGEMVPGLAIMK